MGRAAQRTPRIWQLSILSECGNRCFVVLPTFLRLSWGCRVGTLFFGHNDLSTEANYWLITPTSIGNACGHDYIRLAWRATRVNNASSIVGYPSWRNVSTSASIDRNFATTEAAPENQEFVHINNVETLAQIFTDIRYTAKDCRTMSEGLIEALKMQGFM